MASDDKELTKGGNLKKPSISLVTSRVKSAWDEIPAEMVVKSFLKTGISNSMDGTQDDEIWTETQEDEEDDTEEDDTYLPGWDTDEKITQEEWKTSLEKVMMKKILKGFFFKELLMLLLCFIYNFVLLCNFAFIV